MSNENEYEYSENKSFRVLELFFRAMKGEPLSVKKLAQEYNVSSRSISRDINELKNFFADHRDTIGYVELEYSTRNHCYTLNMDNFLTNKELLAITKALIGCRAFDTKELLSIVNKLKANTSSGDKLRLEALIKKELYQYAPIHFDCQSVIDNVFELSEYIENKRAITITYNRMDRCQVTHKLKPVSIMFTEYYYYLIAYPYEKERENVPTYFRVDRIIGIIAHRENFTLTKAQNIDEGLLRKRSQFMWPGPIRHIRFEFTGPSVQAILDRLPTAKIIDYTNNVYTIDADIYGNGIKMFLLSQGAWVKVIAPDDFVAEMKEEIEKMRQLY